jgi:hypothetical protein
VLELKREVQQATGIPEALTDTIIHALKGADYLGSLLKIDKVVDVAIREHERTAGLVHTEVSQGDMFTGFRPEQTVLSFEKARVSVLEQLDRFLSKCTRGDDLGLRLWGEQLAAGVRFIRLIKEGTYDLVVANPPYQGSPNLADGEYVEKYYPDSKADLYSAFLQRSLQLVRLCGISAMITMRGWMFIKHYEGLRKWLTMYDLRLLGDLEAGAFEEISGEVVTTVMSVVRCCSPSQEKAIALKATDENSKALPGSRAVCKRANLLIGAGRYEFVPNKLKVIEGQPLIYWWDDAFLKRYAETPKLGEVSPAKKGACTSDNTRFLRKPWESLPKNIMLSWPTDLKDIKWVPFIGGAKGRSWIEGLDDIIKWHNNGLEVKTYNEYLYRSFSRSIQNQDRYFTLGIAFSMVGRNFTARAHRFPSIIGDQGSSVYPTNIADTVCLLNSLSSRTIMSALNPTVHYQVGDVNRLPLFPIESADEIFATLDKAFTEYEASRETSVEFKYPATSAWNYTQAWAQKAVDREPGTLLPHYQPVDDDLLAADYVSYAIGVALGRFGANGEGILNEAPITALPSGILYLSSHSDNDSLHHSACQLIKDAWTTYGNVIARSTPLRTWLRQSFFKDVHLGMYESHPIYFPLSSQRRNFVALVSIHRWADNTLQTLLAEYLMPELNQLEGELHDLMAARNQDDRKTQTEAENRYNDAKALYDELKAFIDLVRQGAESGPPPARSQDTLREVDGRFVMALDDGVMINSAALWPLLEPQWKHPRTWWSELCNSKGKNDYDWSHLAARYFPRRVDAKCQHDPSLAVAHGCFWKYHPAKAYEWELRLQDEIGPDFTIDEAHADELRVQFTAEHPEKVKALIAAEHKRREKNRKKTSQASGRRRQNEGELAGEVLG